MAPTDELADSGPHANHRRHFWPDFLAAGIYVVLGVAAYAHAWAGGTTRLVDLASSDPVQQLWFLSWTPFAITHGHSPLFTGYANATHGVNLIANTGEQLLGIISWPVNATLGPVAALNTIFTIAFAASATAGYVLARRFVAWRPAAFVAGLLYGFSPYMIGQAANHLQLAFIAFPPLIFLTIERLLNDAGPRRAVVWGSVLGALVIAQFFVSSEILTDTAIMSLFGVVLLCLLYPGEVRPRVPRFFAGVATAAVLAGVALAYPVVEGLRGPAHITGAIQLAPQLYRADALGIIVPGRTQLLAPSSLLSVSDRFIDGNSTENGSYLGIPLLVVLAAGLAFLRTRLLVFLCSMAAGAWLLSLGSRLVVSAAPTAHPTSGLWLPEALFTKLPLVSNVEPVRFSLFVVLFAALGLAVILDRLRARWRAVSHPLALGSAVAVAAVALFPLLPSVPYAASAVTVPPFFSSSAVDVIPADTAVLLYPFPQFGVDDALPMLWQVRSGFRFKIVGGYFIVPDPPGGGATAISPSPTGAVLDELYAGGTVPRSPALRRQLLGELRSKGVRTVVALPRGRDPEAAISFLSWLVGRSPHRVEGAYVWSRVMVAA